MVEANGKSSTFTMKEHLLHTQIVWAPCGLPCESQNCPKTPYTVYTVKHNAVFCSKRKIISFQVSGMCRKANFQEVQQSQLLPFNFSPLTTLKSTTNRKLWALATLYYNVRRLAPCRPVQ